MTIQSLVLNLLSPTNTCIHSTKVSDVHQVRKKISETRYNITLITDFTQKKNILSQSSGDSFFHSETSSKHATILYRFLTSLKKHLITNFRGSFSFFILKNPLNHNPGLD